MAIKVVDANALKRYDTKVKEHIVTKVTTAKTEVTQRIEAIEAKVPSSSSAANQLATVDFVNSSIATNTSTFRGTYESIDDLPSKSSISDLKLNDYSFIISVSNLKWKLNLNFIIASWTISIPCSFTSNGKRFTEIRVNNPDAGNGTLRFINFIEDSGSMINVIASFTDATTGETSINWSDQSYQNIILDSEASGDLLVFLSNNADLIGPEYDRYKFNGSSWDYEYTLNNSSFTAEQWASIQSGITLDLVSQIRNLKALAFKDSLGKSDVGLGNVDNTSDANKPISTAAQEVFNTKVTFEQVEPTEAEVDLFTGYVSYRAQELTDDQKAQVRTNIAAVSSADLTNVTVNGSSTKAPSFYAPTSVGTDGYVLTSNGSGAPTWKNPVVTYVYVASSTTVSANSSISVSLTLPSAIIPARIIRLATNTTPYVIATTMASSTSSVTSLTVYLHNNSTSSRTVSGVYIYYLNW